MAVGSVFFLCSPDCQKKPRTSFSFYKSFNPIICAKICDVSTLLLCTTIAEIYKFWQNIIRTFVIHWKYYSIRQWNFLIGWKYIFILVNVSYFWIRDFHLNLAIVRCGETQFLHWNAQHAEDKHYSKIIIQSQITAAGILSMQKLQAH